MSGKRPQIVVLDAFCLNPGDLSWEALESLGDCAFYDRSAESEIQSRIASAEIVLTNKVPLSADTMKKAGRLKYIGVTATGHNIIDLKAAESHGIIVTNVPSYGTSSVSQMVFAHVLNLTQRVGDHGREVRAGRWASSPDWCFWDYPLVELDGLAMGIVGFGRIGKATATLAHAFGMKVLAYNRSPIQETVGVRSADLDTVFRESDVVSLHCPLTAETRELVSRERLALMKRSAFLINTSRGPLVDEQALADALNSGRLAGAGLDVLSTEPPSPDNPLVSAKNCYITPHIAWATRASRKRLLDESVENVACYLRGKPRHVVVHR
jgi:glycerate dehydrogenase